MKIIEEHTFPKSNMIHKSAIDKKIVCKHLWLPIYYCYLFCLRDYHKSMPCYYYIRISLKQISLHVSLTPLSLSVEICDIIYCLLICFIEKTSSLSKSLKSSTCMGTKSNQSTHTFSSLRKWACVRVCASDTKLLSAWTWNYSKQVGLVREILLFWNSWYYIFCSSLIYVKNYWSRVIPNLAFSSVINSRWKWFSCLQHLYISDWRNWYEWYLLGLALLNCSLY